MLCKLSLKNIKKSFKDYLIYFATLILGVAVFYMFNSIGSQKNYMKISESSEIMLELLVIIIDSLSVFVACILGILIVYANRFLMKRRNKEFAIYLTLGMSKKKISTLLLIETIFIGAISLTIGVLVGTGLSQIMNLVVIKMFEANVSDYKFVFSTAALGKTVLYFSIMYVVVMLFNVIIVGKCKLIDLINSNRKVEKIRNKNMVVSSILFIISIIALVIAYKIILGDKAIDNLGKAIILGCIGTFLFFWSISGFMLKIFMSMKKVYYKSLNSFLFRQVSSKINTEVFSLTTICLMLFLTICVLSTALSLKNSFNNGLKEGTKVDIQAIKYHVYAEKGDTDSAFSAIYDLENVLKVNMNDYFKEHVEASVYNVEGINIENTVPSEDKKVFESFTVDYYENVMKLSDFNKILSIYGEKELVLSDNEYVVYADYEPIVDIRNKDLKKNTKLTVGSNVLIPKYNKCQYNDWQMGAGDSNFGFYVLPDMIVDNYKVNTVYTTVLANYKVSSENARKKIEKKLFNYINTKYKALNKEDNRIMYLSSKIATYEASKGLGVFSTFIGLYLGIVFLITCVAILALKSLSESIDNKQRFGILRKIGADEKMINGVLVRQIGISFILPLLLACVHAYFGNKFAAKMLVSFKINKDIESVVITAIIIALIYGGYFALTFISGKNILNDKK